MPDKIDRRIGGNNQLLVTVLIIIAVAAAAGAYVYVMGPLSAPTSQPAQDIPGNAGQAALSEERLTIILSVPGNNGMLSAEMISLSRQIETQAQAREALIAALADQRVIQTPVLNRLKLRAFFLDESGTGYVDLGPVADGGIQASAREELLAIYAIVNTLCQNFEDIRQVRFLIDGKEAQTLAGHMDLSRRFTKRMDLVR
jgi:hypothetical protein